MYKCVLMPMEARGVRLPRAGATNDREVSYGSWESNLGPLEEQPVLLTTGTSLQSLAQALEG